MAQPLRDAAPSMGWAYSAKESGATITIDIRDCPVLLTPGEQGALLSTAGPAASPGHGKPSLPIIVLLWEVPAGSSYTVTWSVASSETTPVPRLAPVATPVVRSAADGVFRPGMESARDPGVYDRDEYWPEALVRYEEARAAGRRFLRIEVFPFQYKPVRGLLRAHRGIQVVLSRVGRESGE